MPSSSLYLALRSTILVLVVIFAWHGEVIGQCLEQQKSLLLKLKQSLAVGISFEILNQWSLKKDCCGWKGVACNDKGHIIGLDLSYEGSYLNNTSPLFLLQHLTTLKMVSKGFQLSNDKSSGFERLVNLRKLNISYGEFLGRFPYEISNLTKLVSLDLSYSIYNGRVSYKGLIGNLSKLEKLKLDDVDYMRLGMHGSEWSKTMSSSLPRLKVLSLINVGLTGPIDASFQNLTFLSVIHLSKNAFKMQIPSFFSKFKYLTSLRLVNCTLEGHMPSSLNKLRSLTYLDLSHNKLSGPVPSFSSAINMKYLSLWKNRLTGSILNTNWGNLSQLEVVDLYSNYLTGSIPSSLIGNPALLRLDISFNNFVNFTDESVSTSSSKLKRLYLADNDLQGPFPSIIYRLKALKLLDLEFNNLSGTFHLESLQQLKNLTHMIISFNKFSVEFGDVFHNLPRLNWIGMASCKLKAFPHFLKNNTHVIYHLDISANQIRGEIPGWIWDFLASGSYLNFSHNHLDTFEAQVENTQYCGAKLVDLSYNNLHGKLPMLEFAEYLDLSENSFDLVVFDTLYTSAVGVLYVSNNFLRGNIPKSLCDVRLSVLDLSGNFLNGTIPSCLLQNTQLMHLNLKNNTISGTIPDSLPSNCNLVSAILNGNLLEGSIPKSFGNCARLSLLDLGDNKLHDVFPCWVSNISVLAVLILKSNILQGSIVCPDVNVSWPNLQILDISSNNFSGDLPSRQLFKWKMMLVNDSRTRKYLTQEFSDTSYDSSISEEDGLPIHEIDGINIAPYVIMSYTSITLVLKGTNMVIPKIFTNFALIDLSDNKFEGSIPEEIGHFTALRQLNISHNKLRGRIPSSIGNMQSLETLDLRKNELSGNIPRELAHLKSLSVLNLSFNKLEGKIPSGNQLQTFSEYSFLHNEGLCGLPLNTSCDKTEGVTPKRSSSIFEGEILISAEVGYALGLGFIIMPLIFCSKWRMRFYEFTRQNTTPLYYYK